MAVIVFLGCADVEYVPLAMLHVCKTQEKTLLALCLPLMSGERSYQ